ncbi:AzlD domain-containing protein [Mesobacterium sp. TK19101]|uniref:AzlD domain-containing protein n=1 Tax=Mesobacterium hydrothermale TaxID=3111907 RepID=A0ABU6HMR5_9RHOB|nr:AzlD domain-containing protein [Mesobacterium sp. TK19101]MEC3862718.1 AzlD domain-containing protein [Mesobacterium sp. TK19101]
MIDRTDLWIVIAGLGLGSFGLRFIFLGVVGDRPLPEWLMRHLRYTAVAVLPALVAPIVLWPRATGGEPDPLRLTAAAVAFATGYFSKNVMLGMLAGAAVMIGAALLG